jgi:hypothetical protein
MTNDKRELEAVRNTLEILDSVSAAVTYARMEALNTNFTMEKLNNFFKQVETAIIEAETELVAYILPNTQLMLFTDESDKQED